MPETTLPLRELEGYNTSGNYHAFNDRLRLYSNQPKTSSTNRQLQRPAPYTGKRMTQNALPYRREIELRISQYQKAQSPNEATQPVVKDHNYPMWAKIWAGLSLSLLGLGLVLGVAFPGPITGALFPLSLLAIFAFPKKI